MAVVDGSGRAAAATHPLDPLRAEEIREIARIVREQHASGARARFVSIALREPTKAELADGVGVPREAEAILHDPDRNAVHEAVVSLAEGRIRSSRHVEGAQAPFLAAEWEPFVAAIKADDRYRAALARRGVEDLDLVSIDPIPYGWWEGDPAGGRRLCRASTFVRSRPGGNRHARHVEGLVCVVDLNRLEVLEVQDHGVVELPPDPGEYDADRVGHPREGLRPLEIVQPDGPSFAVDGWQVTWQRWRFRVGFTAREGLVLHALEHEDDGRWRSILHRASYTELAVTYADTSPAHWFMSFFDFGELQPGLLANALTLGCDCLGAIRYLDVVLAGADGEPVVLPNAICMHEEDVGVLWKHADLGEGRNEVRRSRRLVVSWIGTFGNYEYAFYWYLYQDGTIASEVKLTGIVQTAVMADDSLPASGVLVAPRVNAMSHQHFFNVRLDLDLDGVDNAVEETWAEPIPLGPENPHGTAFASRSRRFATEREARRLVDPLSARSWQVVNPSSRNALGQPVAYRLVPGETVGLLAQEQSPYGRRAAFARHHLHVTPFDARERYAGGDYPYQHPGGDGIATWTGADRPIDGADIVVWYSFGHHHVSRPEDWPVMPVAAVGFALKPVGFFDRNPSLDVPPPEPRASHACCT